MLWQFVVDGIHHFVEAECLSDAVDLVVKRLDEPETAIERIDFLTEEAVIR